MTTSELANLVKVALVGELEGLRDAVKEMTASVSEEQFWTKPIEPGNSAGHLVLHLTGNLKYFVGAELGKTGYIRDREREFTETNHPSKEQALAGLDEAVAIFRRVVEGLTPEHLAEPHPTERLGSVLNALVHLTAHFALHRGQMSYITRLVAGTA